MNFLDALLAWVQAFNDFLGLRGVVVTCGRPDDSRPKASCYLNLRRGDAEADLVLWETGEAELALVVDGAAPVQAHEDLSGLDELGMLLARMLQPFPPDGDRGPAI